MRLRDSVSLKPWQNTAVAHLRNALEVERCGILGDEMGLGKTLTALALACVYGSDRAPVLVVAPSSVLVAWEREFHQRVEGGSLQRIDGARARRQRLLAAPATVCLVTYGTLVSTTADFCGVAWGMLIMDECHKATNRETRVSRALRTLPSAPPRLALTGTPCANSPARDLAGLCLVTNRHRPELWDPASFGDGPPAAFRRIYLGRTASSVRLALPGLRTAHVRRTFRHGWETAAYAEQLARVRRAFQAYVSAPPTMRHAFRTAYQSAIMGLGVRTTHADIPLVAQGRLRPEDARESTKGGLVLDVLARTTSKTIVSSRYASMLRILDAQLAARGIATVLFTGEVPGGRRDALLRRWEADDGPRVLLLSTGVGAHGLTLTRAHRIVAIDTCSDPNPANHDQLVKRVHRLGQTRACTIVSLVVRGTIDEALTDAVHPSKRALSEVVLGKRARGAARAVPAIIADVEARWRAEGARGPPPAPVLVS